MNRFGSRADLAHPANIALLCDDGADAFVADALGQLAITTGVLLVADDPGFLADLQGEVRLDFTQAGLVDIPIKLAEVRAQIQAVAGAMPGGATVIVDMRWAVAQNQPKEVITTMKTPELGSRMTELTCPILTFWGANDEFMPPQGKEKCLKANETSRFIEVNACGHWVMIEHARMFNAVSIDFLANN